MRIAVGGFYHETNTRARTTVNIQAFKDYQFAVGNQLIKSFAGTNSEIGGMLAGIVDAGAEPVPLLFAAAVPSGLIERSCYDEILNALVEAISRNGQIDAVLLSLHGAAVVDGILKPDTNLVAAIHHAVGRDTLIGVTLDYHANVDPWLVELADFVTVYRTYPHTDMAERGREVVRVIADQGRPGAKSFVKLPMITVPLVQATADQPMLKIMSELEEATKSQGIASASIAMGFAYADTPSVGATVLVYGDRQTATDNVARRLATLVWQSRDQLSPELVLLGDLPGRLDRTEGRPTIVVDPADNIGGGSAGDGTTVLKALLTSRRKGAIVITDANAVEHACKVGLGARFSGEVGGHTDDLHGEPVRIEGKVIWLGEARFTNSSSYMTGFETSMGLSAVIDVDGLNVVLTTLRTMPFDLGVLTSVGLDPRKQEVIVVKSAIAWQAAFGPLASDVVIVDTPGICPPSLRPSDYVNAPRPAWPLDDNASIP